MHFNDTKNLSLAQVVSVNGLTIYPFSFKYSRNYFHKSCFILKQDAITEGKYLRWFVNAL